MRQPEPRLISIDELRALLDSGDPVWLVYAPDRAAFVDAHIPGSLARPAPDVLRSLLRTAQLVVVYGEDGQAAVARRIAVELDAPGVRWFRDGLEGWVQAGGAIDRSSHDPR